MDTQDFPEPPSMQLTAIIDSPSFPYLAFTQALWNSGDQPLDIIITIGNPTIRNPKIDWFADPQIERTMVTSIMHTLEPHLSRIRTLKFYTVYYESLPTFPTDFRPMALLKELEILGVEHDRSIPNARSMILAVPNASGYAFQYPQLTDLSIAGRNCYMLSKIIDWTVSLAPITTLTISHFTPKFSESFTVGDLVMPIAKIQTLENLSICFVKLDISYEPFEPVWRTQLHLTLVGMTDFFVIDKIITFFKPGAIYLTECSVPIHAFSDYLPPYTASLHLRNIYEDLTGLLCSWDGKFLEIADCPVFTDSILQQMGTQNELGLFKCAPLMHTLVIVTDYLNFSIHELKKMVEARHSSRHAELTGLYIRVSANAPAISEEDIAWFISKLGWFAYFT